MKLDNKPYEEKMQKTITVYEGQLDTVRAGRANTAVLNGIDVEYYGTPTAINQMAEVKVTDARTIAITPWDVTTVKSIEKALLASELGITPQSDGKVIRLLFPQLTEERRKEMTKQVAKMGEDTKVSIRNIRRDAIDKAKELKKSGDMTEDEQKQSEKTIQELTDKYIKEVDAVTANKEMPAEKPAGTICFSKKSKPIGTYSPLICIKSYRRLGSPISPLSWTATADGQRAGGFPERLGTV